VRLRRVRVRVCVCARPRVRVRVHTCVCVCVHVCVHAHPLLLPQHRTCAAGLLKLCCAAHRSWTCSCRSWRCAFQRTHTRTHAHACARAHAHARARGAGSWLARTNLYPHPLSQPHSTPYHSTHLPPPFFDRLLRDPSPSHAHAHTSTPAHPTTNPPHTHPPTHPPTHRHTHPHTCTHARTHARAHTHGVQTRGAGWWRSTRRPASRRSSTSSRPVRCFAT
jgi:hypothetical protein